MPAAPASAKCRRSRHASARGAAAAGCAARGSPHRATATDECVSVDPDDRHAAVQGFIKRFLSAATFALTLPIPDDDQQIRLVENYAATSAVSFGLRGSRSVEFELRGCLGQQCLKTAERVVPLQSLSRRKILFKLGLAEWQDAKELESEFQCVFGENPVSAFRQRGDGFQHRTSAVIERLALMRHAERLVFDGLSIVLITLASCSRLALPSRFGRCPTTPTRKASGRGGVPRVVAGRTSVTFICGPSLITAMVTISVRGASIARLRFDLIQTLTRRYSTGKVTDL